MGDWRVMDDHELTAVEIRQMRQDAMQAERRRVEAVEAMKAAVAAVELIEADEAEADVVVSRMRTLLTETSNALKGEPDPLRWHDWSDLPQVARASVLRQAACQAHLQAAMAKLAEYGWLPFGTNVDNGPVDIVFSSQVDEAGDPYFERVTS
jgi:DNA-binding NarL/FixJ family response regulator